MIIKVQVEDLPKHRVKSPDKSTPEYSIFDYCRKLKEEGYSDETVVESYRGDVLSLRTTVGHGADHTIMENEKESPKVVKYRIHPMQMHRRPA